MLANRFKATCFLTFHCNYQCPYCQYNQEKIWLKNPDIDGEWWIRFFKSLPASLIHFTGGEPFCYRDFFSIMEELPFRHIFWVISNLSPPIDTLKRFIDKVHQEQLLVFCASLHPLQKQFNLREFKDKIRFLLSHGIPVLVNYVAYPPQLHLVPKLRDHITNVGAIFNVEPFISADYSYSEQEQEVVKQLVVQQRKMNYCWEERGMEKWCSAGMDYVTVVSTGDIYRCQSGFARHNKEEFKLGNIVSGFSLNSIPLSCFEPCPSTCDQHMVTITDGEGNVIHNTLYRSELELLLVKSLSRHRTIRKLWEMIPQRQIFKMVS